MRWGGGGGLWLPFPLLPPPPGASASPAQWRRQRPCLLEPICNSKRGRGPPTPRPQLPARTPPRRWVRSEGRGGWGAACLSFPKERGCPITPQLPRLCVGNPWLHPWGAGEGTQASGPPLAQHPDEPVGLALLLLPFEGCRGCRPGRGEAPVSHRSLRRVPGGVPGRLPSTQPGYGVSPPSPPPRAPIRPVLLPGPPGPALHRPARHPRPGPDAGCQDGCQAGWGRGAAPTAPSAPLSPRRDTTPPPRCPCLQSIPVFPVLPSLSQ